MAYGIRQCNFETGFHCFGLLWGGQDPAEPMDRLFARATALPRGLAYRPLREETFVMPKNQQTSLGTMNRPTVNKRSAAAIESTRASAKRLLKKKHQPHHEKELTRIDPDRLLPIDDEETRQRKAREFAVVSLTPDELLALRMQPETETTFTEDDARACPRDLEAFRVAVSLEIDRLRANKKNYEF